MIVTSVISLVYNYTSLRIHVSGLTLCVCTELVLNAVNPKLENENDVYIRACIVSPSPPLAHVLCSVLLHSLLSR